MGGERIPALGELPAGTRVASYQIEELVGRGGMAMVYRAFDVRLGRSVALKVLSSDLARDDAFRQRFVRESRAGAAVDHPNVIPVFEAGDAGGILYIAMRYVPGQDVRALLQQSGPLPVRRAVSLVTQIASALDAAHALGLVHRDVKPANMLLGTVGDGETLDHVYLSDFGLSKLAMGSNSHLTGTGQFLGTIDYMAPEQVSGREVDGRTDQYALACAAFEMLADVPPFRRDENLAVMWAQVSAAPPSVRERRPELAPAVDEVLSRALAKAPADRYPTCVDFAAALRVAVTAPPGQATEVAAPRLAGLAVDAARPPAPPATELAQSPAAPAPTATELAQSPAAPAPSATELAQSPMPPGIAPTAPFAPTQSPGDAAGGGAPGHGGQGGLGAIGLAPKPGGHGAGGYGAGGHGAGGHGAGGYGAGDYPGPSYPPGGYPAGGFPGPSYPPGGFPGPGQQPPPRRGKGPLIMLIVVVVLALGGAAVFFLHPGGLFQPAASGSPKPARTVTVTPPASGSPASSATAPMGPADTVSAYFSAINSQDYQKAWDINVSAHSSEDYATFAAGFNTTEHDSVTITGVSGNVVSIQLSALHTDGTLHLFHGTYTVVNGQIVNSYILKG